MSGADPVPSQPARRSERSLKARRAVLATNGERGGRISTLAGQGASVPEIAPRSDQKAAPGFGGIENGAASD
jgi:hypothetical protein